jgi:hypothetical protein
MTTQPQGLWKEFCAVCSDDGQTASSGMRTLIVAFLEERKRNPNHTLHNVFLNTCKNL